MARFYLAAISILLLANCNPGRRVSAAPATESYKQDAQGLEKQFEGYLRAYHKRDDKGMDEAFTLFRIPNAKEWFANYFSPEDAAKLNTAYDGRLNDAQNSLADDLSLADPGAKFRVHCEARGEIGGGQGKSGGGGVQPVKPVKVEQFVLEFSSGGNGRKFLMIVNFVYEGGAYRFVGGGGGAFWVTM